MNKELTDKLYSAYPDIFRERSLSMQETCMCWGIDCGDGWYKIIDELCANLKELQKATGYQIVATQVKEKFGKLCFYYKLDSGKAKEGSDEQRWNRIIHCCIQCATTMSAQTCEQCGERGELKSSSIAGMEWWRALCEGCRAKENIGRDD